MSWIFNDIERWREYLADRKIYVGYERRDRQYRVHVSTPSGECVFMVANKYHLWSAIKALLLACWAGEEVAK